MKKHEKNHSKAMRIPQSPKCLLLPLVGLMTVLLVFGWVGQTKGENGEEDAGDAASKVFEQTFSQAMPTRNEVDIDISHSHGDITVKGWDKNEVKLEGKKIVKAKDRETARKYAEKMKVEISSEGNKIVVKTLRPQPNRSWRIRKSTINYELYAPKRLNATLKNEHGNVVVESFLGKLDANSRHGNLQVLQIGKDASIQHEHGNVEVYQVGENASVDKRHGELKMEGVGGELKLIHEHGNVDLAKIGKSAGLTKRHGNLSAVDVGGALQLDHEHGNVQLKLIQGDVKMNKRHGNMGLETVNGNFSLSSEHGNLEAMDIKGEFHWRSSHGNGDIENVSGGADIACSHGNITLYNVKGAVDVENEHSGVEVISSQPVAHPYRLHTEHASLKLALPKNSKVDIFAHTAHGSIHSNLPLTVTKKGSEVQVEGKMNAGGTPVELSTRHGNITIDFTK